MDQSGCLVHRFLLYGLFNNRLLGSTPNHTNQTDHTDQTNQLDDLVGKLRVF